MLADNSQVRLVWMVLLLFPALLPARPVDPYVGQVAVADASTESVAQAYRESLVQVLTKSSGAPELVAQLAAEDALGNAEPLVLQHGFVESELIDNADQRMLQVRFSADQVKQRLSDLGLPFWPLERPETIAWIAIQSDSERRLLGLAADDDALLARLTSSGDLYGVPLVLPLLDLDDQRAVQPADIWGGFADVVQRASARYGVVQVLLGRAFPDATGWAIRWTLTGADYTEGWSSRGTNLTGAIQSGISDMARRMGHRYALRASDEGQRPLLVRVRGINSAADYGRIMTYLRKLSVVSSVDPRQAQGDTLDIQLTTATGLRGLVQVLRTAEQVQIAADRKPPGVDLVVEIGR